MLRKFLTILLMYSPVFGIDADNLPPQIGATTPFGKVLAVASATKPDGKPKYLYATLDKKSGLMKIVVIGQGLFSDEVGALGTFSSELLNSRASQMAKEGLNETLGRQLGNREPIASILLERTGTQISHMSLILHAGKSQVPIKVRFEVPLEIKTVPFLTKQVPTTHSKSESAHPIHQETPRITATPQPITNENSNPTERKRERSLMQPDKLLADVSATNKKGKIERLYATLIGRDEGMKIRLSWNDGETQKEHVFGVITNAQLASELKSMMRGKGIQESPLYWVRKQGRSHVVLVERKGEELTHLVLQLQVSPTHTPVRTRFEIPKEAKPKPQVDLTPPFLVQYQKCQEDVVLLTDAFQITGNSFSSKDSYFIMDYESFTNPNVPEHFFVLLSGQAFLFTVPPLASTNEIRQWKLQISSLNKEFYVSYEWTSNNAKGFFTPSRLHLAGDKNTSYKTILGFPTAMENLQSTMRTAMIRSMNAWLKHFRKTIEIWNQLKTKPKTGDASLDEAVKKLNNTNLQEIADYIPKLEKCRAVNDSVFQTELSQVSAKWKELGKR